MPLVLELPNIVSKISNKTNNTKNANYGQMKGKRYKVDLVLEVDGARLDELKLL